MTSTDFLMILAILTGPILAVLISIWVGNKIAEKKAKRDQQFLILATLVAMQWKPVSEEHVKALNAVDLFFHDVKPVREKWKEYFESLGRRDLSDQEALETWKNKRIELVHAMASHLGYKDTLEQLDFDRVYSPEGLVSDFFNNPETIDAFILFWQERKRKLEKPKEDDEQSGPTVRYRDPLALPTSSSLLQLRLKMNNKPDEISGAIRDWYPHG